MKREGRQRGMIRTYPIVTEAVINKLGSPPTAGLFTKVSQKPTNHSKFTGKCGRPKCNSCHIHPTSKSKDKAKGANKLRSLDIVSNHKFITWGLVDSSSAVKLSGLSATGILDLLGNDNYKLGNCGDSEEEEEEDVHYERNEEDEIEEINVDEDAMSFCEVDLVWEEMDEEDWCIVEEI